MALNALTLACSAANPILYTSFSVKFRSRFAVLLCCRNKADYAPTAYTAQPLLSRAGGRGFGTVLPEHDGSTYSSLQRNR